MKGLVITFLAFLSGAYISYAQPGTNHPVDPERIEKNITPVAPDVASLGKFAMQPPNYSNGQSQQNIPIYTIKENGIEYSLGLNYSFSGFQPTQDASIAGLGWTLTEGIITRLVRGLADDNPSLYKRFDQFDFTNLVSETGAGVNGPNAYPNVARYYDFTANRIYNKLYDGQPDVYVFNFNGHTGRFLFLGGQAYVYPHGDYHIRKDGTDFIIETPDGISYTFFAADASFTWHSRTYAGITSMTDDYYGLGCSGEEAIRTYSEGNTTNTWRIKKIFNKTTKATINFTYSFYSVDKYKRDISSVTFWNDPGIVSPSINGLNFQHSSMENIATPSDGSPTHTQSSCYYLSGIISDNSTVVVKTKDRSDFAAVTTAKAIDEIDIYNNQNLLKPIKKAVFTHGYFKLDGETNPDNQWLKLQKISITGGGENKEYAFSYNDIEQRAYYGLSKNTYAVDHWGYYNGINNQYMVPRSDIINYYQNDLLSNINLDNLPWADRTPNFDYAKLFGLTSVKYPTGGYTNIVYESAGGRGVRVRSMEDNDGHSGYQKFYEYFPDNAIAAPTYNYSLYNMDMTNSNCSGSYALKYLTVTASTRNTLDYFDDNSNFYESITEYLGTPDGQAGRTIYHYTRDDLSSYTPYLTETDQYKYGETSPLKKVINTYEKQAIQTIQYWSEPKVNIMGNCMSCLFSYTDDGTPIYISYPSPTDPLYSYNYLLSDISIIPYSFSTNWYKLTQTDDYDYTTPTSYAVNTEKYYYNDIDPNNHLPKNSNTIRVEHLLSNNKVSSTKMYYPGDVDPDNSGVVLGIPQMWDIGNANYKYFTDPVVKSKNFVDNVLRSYETSSYTFDASNNLIVLSAVERHPKATDEKQKWTFSYDNKANPVTSQKEHNLSKSFIWDYNKHFVIAEVTNATPDLIAYTSFESDGNGNWLGIDPNNAQVDPISITGTRNYLMNGTTLQKSVSNTRSYVVSYWSKNGSLNVNGTSGVQGRSVALLGTNWTYYEHLLSNPNPSLVTVQGSGVIDELRLYPSDAQMTTNTYDLINGISNQCDINNRITYYEYDDFGRPVVVRDQDRNIVKKYCYNYAGQTENCMVTAPAWWQATGNIRCVKDVNNQNTGVQEQEQKDLNPSSSTYNQIRWQNNGTNIQACPLAYVYAKFSYENNNGVTADLVVRFYYDAAGTQPASVSNLTVYLEDDTEDDLSGDQQHIPYQFTVSGSEVTLISSAFIVEHIREADVDANIYHSYFLNPGNGYQIIY